MSGPVVDTVTRTWPTAGVVGASVLHAARASAATLSAAGKQRDVRRYMEGRTESAGRLRAILSQRCTGFGGAGRHSLRQRRTPPRLGTSAGANAILQVSHDSGDGYIPVSVG